MLLPAIIFALALWTLDNQIHSSGNEVCSGKHYPCSPESPGNHDLSNFFKLFRLNRIRLPLQPAISTRHCLINRLQGLSFISTSISYTAGFNFLTGGSLRYRLLFRVWAEPCSDLGNYNFLHLHFLGRVLLYCRLAFHILSSETVGICICDSDSPEFCRSPVTAASCCLFLSLIPKMGL